MPVLERAALEESPLADLHTIASELSIDSYRRLRRPELIDAILERQGEAPARPARRARAKKPDAARSEAAKSDAQKTDAPTSDTPKSEAKDEDEKPAPNRRSRAKAKPEPEPEAEPEAERDDDAEQDQGTASRARRRRGGRGRPRGDEETTAAEESRPGDGDGDEDVVVEGVVELLANGSGFVRVQPPDPSDDDVYVSAAQVKRCELVSGDKVSGPRRSPRRSERFASLVRIDTINGRPASELSDGARYDELPAEFPSDRFKLGSEDPTIKAIEWLTPFGRGSRVTIVGAARSGKTEALRRLLDALAGDEELQVSVVLAGVRPEEISLWNQGEIEPVAAVSFAGSSEAQAHAVELAVDQAKRIAARGANAIVLIDSLDGLHPSSARKVMAAARNITDGGSLTIIATSSEPLGGETTVISLDAALTSTGRFPAIDLAGSGTARPELLVGNAGAEAIARARAEALD